MSKRFLCVGESYKNAQGEDKVAWKRIGEIFTAKSGKEYAKLYMHPGVLISVFEDEQKNAPAKAAVKQSEFGPLEADSEIPF